MPTDELIFLRGVGQPPTSTNAQLLSIFWNTSYLPILLLKLDIQARTLLLPDLGLINHC